MTKTVKQFEQELAELRAQLANMETLATKERERASFLQAVIDGAGDVIQVIDRNGVPSFTSANAEQASGYTAEEMNSMSIYDLYPPEDIVRLRTVQGELVGGPLGESRLLQFRARHKSGNWHLLEASVVNCMKPPVCGLIAVVRDATDRVHADMARHETDEALRTVFNSVQDAIIIHDDNGKLSYANDKTWELFRIPRADAGYLPRADELMGTLSSGGFMEEIWAEVLAGTVRCFEWQFCRDVDGSVFDAEMYFCQIPIGGEFRILTTIRDITDRKTMERDLAKALATSSRLRAEAEAASEAKSRFLASMSHELRTPLNAVIGFSELLEEQVFGDLNDRQAEYTKEITEAGRLVLCLINDVLDLSKVEAGKMELQLARLDVSELLDHCVMMIRERAYKKGLKVEACCYEDDKGTVIQADEVKLKQIIYNLLSNAVKFTPSGGTITLKAERNGDELVTSVSDTGVGIREEFQELVFESFQQIYSPISKQHHGTGLGLALTRKLVELHGGSIRVCSEGEGKGSAFTFAIPLIEVAEGEVQSRTRKKVPGFSGLPGPRVDKDGKPLRPLVLVVEDNPANMRLTTNLLDAAGYGVLQAWTAEQGIQMARAQMPALILMDISLPGMDGLAATAILKRTPDTRKIPIVALSAHAMAPSIQQALAAGCDAYLTKPVEIKAFSDILSVLTSTTGAPTGREL